MPFVIVFVFIGIMFFGWWFSNWNQKSGVFVGGVGSVGKKCMVDAMNFAAQYMPEKDIPDFKIWMYDTVRELVVKDEDNWKSYIETLPETNTYYPKEETKRFLYEKHGYRDGATCLAMVALICYLKGSSPKAEIQFYDSYWGITPEPVFKYFGMDKKRSEEYVVSKLGAVKWFDRKY